ncbi:protein of unknown function (plasmid) [Caballeronia sp. S22]
MTTYVHELKTDHEPFAAILSGEKTHEIRYDDRGFKVGDTLVLRETRYSRGEMFSEGRPLEYTGRTAERVVTHIQRGYGLPRSMVVMSLASLSASIADTAPVFRCNDCESFNIEQVPETMKAAESEFDRGYKRGYVDGERAYQWKAASIADTAERYAQACLSKQIEVDHETDPRPDQAYNRACADCAEVVRSIADTAGAKPVAWQYENQHGNPFLTHKDPETWHPHDRNRFKNFRALVFAAPPAPSVADAKCMCSGLGPCEKLSNCRKSSSVADAAWASEWQAVAKINGTDEYGPLIGWHVHWVDLIGKSLYAAIAAPPAPSVADADITKEINK